MMSAQLTLPFRSVQYLDGTVFENFVSVGLSVWNAVHVSPHSIRFKVEITLGFDDPPVVLVRCDAD